MSTLLLSTSSEAANLQCLLVIKYASAAAHIGGYETRSKYAKRIHRYPALIVPGNADNDVIIFGNQAVCQYMFESQYNHEINIILGALESILSQGRGMCSLLYSLFEIRMMICYQITTVFVLTTN